MSLWAHLKTFLSDPGFIPRGYNYNINLMTPENVSLFNYINLNREKREMVKTELSMRKSKSTFNPREAKFA